MVSEIVLWTPKLEIGVLWAPLPETPSLIHINIHAEATLSNMTEIFLQPLLLPWAFENLFQSLTMRQFLSLIISYTVVQKSINPQNYIRSMNGVKNEGSWQDNLQII